MGRFGTSERCFFICYFGTSTLTIFSSTDWYSIPPLYCFLCLEQTSDATGLHTSEDDVVKRHEEAKAAEAAKNLPVGFIAQDVKKEYTPPPAPEPTKEPVKEAIPFGFIAEDVKKEHHSQ